MSAAPSVFRVHLSDGGKVDVSATTPDAAVKQAVAGREGVGAVKVKRVKEQNT